MDCDTFLTKLYVLIDDFCQAQGFNEKHRPGLRASLSRSEVVKLAMFGQWAQFRKSNAPSTGMRSATREQRFRPCLSASHSNVCTFRRARERSHALDGFQARLAAKVALYNFCIWLNLQLGRELLAFADLLDW